MAYLRERMPHRNLDRYNRHYLLPGFGQAGQEKLHKSHVAVVGAGGLGCPVLQYLVAAGVGRITLIDGDMVDETNLQRQVLFGEADVGRPKAPVAAHRLRALNGRVEIIPVSERVTAANALEWLAPADVIVDCTDNFPTRYLLCDASLLLRKPLVFGSVFRFEGQVSVFNYRGSPCYRDLHPQPPAPGSVPDCAEGGVLGSVCGVVGSMMANETLNVIAGFGQPLAGKLMLFDSRQGDTYTVAIPARGAAKGVTRLIDYDQFCGVPSAADIKELSVAAWQGWQANKTAFTLVDVREPDEYRLANLGGLSIPLSTLEHHVDKIPVHHPVVMLCQSGARSRQAIAWLQANHSFKNLYNVTGGLRAWMSHTS
ncbi:MAG: HesA/MoeB/ThiF family protein [Cyclobacteriaceae bacterium]|nr:HesA/MoeB/ThiF family protein [Cyclobacteriaceae bacterium]